MKNIPSLLRRLFNEPDAKFSKNLRGSLLRHFSGEQKEIEGKMYFLVPENPHPEFKNDLRAALIREMQPEKKSTWKKTQEIFSSFHTGAALSVATILFFSLAIFGLSPTGSASGTTTLSSFSGDVFVEENLILENGGTIAPQQTLSTGENSFATLSFFEDSLVRMDENTEIEIDSLTPHKLRADLGEVHVILKKGRIWVRSASAYEQYSRFIVTKADTNVVLDFGGAAEIFTEKQDLVVRVWDRMVRILPTTGEELLLSQNEKFTQTLLNEKREEMAVNEEKDAWTLYNLQEDSALYDTFVLQKIEQQAEKNTSTITKIKEVFAGASDEKELEIFFFDTLSLMASGEQQDEALFLKDFEEKVYALAEKSPEDTEAFLASAEKSLAFVLPDSPFFAIKKQLAELQPEITDTVLAMEKARTQKLWEASMFARTGHTVLAKSIVQETSDIVSGNTGEITSEILEEREAQMVALSQIESQDELSDSAEIAQEELVYKTQSALYRPGFPHSAEKKEAPEKAQKVIRKIKKYESEVGQKNTLLAQLSSIENSIENIPLVLEIKTRLPDNLQGEAQRKILDILAAERKKR